MARYYIDTVKCGVTQSGMACGPVPGTVVAEAHVTTDDGQDFYMVNVEADGLPNFCKTEKSYYDMIMAEDPKDEAELAAMCQRCQVDDISEYKDLMFIDELPQNSLLLYLAYVVRSNWEECQEFTARTHGKWLDEIVIPICDYEEDLLIDNEYTLGVTVKGQTETSWDLDRARELVFDALDDGNGEDFSANAASPEKAPENRRVSLNAYKQSEDGTLEFVNYLEVYEQRDQEYTLVAVNRNWTEKYVWEYR